MAEVNLDGIITNNSDAVRRQEQTAEPPVEEFNPLVERKPSFLSRMFGHANFTSNFEGAGQTVLEEVIIPTLIDGLRDVIYTATDYILYGGGQRRSRNGRRSGGGSYTSYSKKSQQRGASTRRTAPSATSYYFTYDDRTQADKDLEKMRDVVDQRDFVTILDMFSIAKRQTSNYTYSDWGWYDLRSAMVRRTTDGRYYIDLPKPVPIEE